MKLFGRKKKQTAALPMVQTSQARNRYEELRLHGGGSWEWALYKDMRENIPVINAAICKLQRLMGGFEVTCGDEKAEKELRRFLSEVNVNGTESGIGSYVSCCLDSLLTYGTAVSEIVIDSGGEDIAALFNADLRNVELRRGSSPLELDVYSKTAEGPVPVMYPELISVAMLNPPDGESYGVSLLRSLPFVCGILMRIYRTIGVNWDRVGNLRFAVNYKPGGESGLSAQENAKTLAEEWSRVMEPGSVSDFVAMGDVSVKVIGADGQIPDSEIPVRQMLEQIVAALGVPPFLLGFSWSSTERMSSQQADILTSELEYYRRLLEPSILKVCRLWLILHGFEDSCTVQWEDITLQDATELAEARLKNAQAQVIENSL